ncbi:MAG: hypothetical protein M3T96_06670 [Acidobacteriota bacterium]|nr:hypothetical protein [Acidobacteriota bacterium]
MKFLLGLCFVLLSASVLFAQTNPVEITGGRIYVTPNPSPGNVQIQTANFTVTGGAEWSLTPFSSACPPPSGCVPGKTFKVAAGRFFYLGDTYLRGGNNTFSINGNTYQNVFFEGETILEEVSFSVAKSFAYRKKGTTSLRKPFTYTTQMRVCSVSMASGPCPSDKLLFDGNLIGHGTLTLTLQSNFSAYYGTFYTIKSYDYQFE